VPRVAPLDDFDPRKVGPYALIGRLGHGGMGSVYLGRHTRMTGAPMVAIKIIRGDLADSPQFRARFEREAQAALRVTRSYTAGVLDFDTANSRPYLVTEYIDGPTLSAHVRDRGPLTASDLEWLAQAIASALRAIHAANVIHRDLKPGNILLSRFGARVIDFGISHALDATTMFTQGPIGTPAYMAPEQVLGEQVTEAIDVHAWGAVLLFAATGRDPFEGDTVHAVMRRVVETAPDFSRLPESLRSLVIRAMSKNPADRPGAGELTTLLQHLHSSSAPARAAGTGEPAVPPSEATVAYLDQIADLRGPRVPAGSTAGVAPPPDAVPADEVDPPSTRTALTLPVVGVDTPPSPVSPPRPSQPLRRRLLLMSAAAGVAAVMALTSVLVIEFGPWRSPPPDKDETHGTSSPAGLSPTTPPPTAVKANLDNPSGVAVGPDGALYIADTGNNRILRADAAGQVTAIAGTGRKGYSGDGGQAVAADLDSPLALTVGPDGTVYFTDAGPFRVRKIDAAGRISTVAGTGGDDVFGDFSGDGAALETQMWVNALAVASDGSLYVADEASSRIRRVDAEGRITTIAGTGNPLTNYDSGLTGDGGPATQTLLGCGNVCGVAVGPDHLTYIADEGNNRIRTVDAQGRIRTLAGGGDNPPEGGGKATDVKLVYPLGVTVAPDGTVYFWDESPVAGDNPVWKVDGAGRISLVSTVPSSLADICAGPDGYLYVAEPNENRIQRIDQSGRLVTVVD